MSSKKTLILTFVLILTAGLLVFLKGWNTGQNKKRIFTFNPREVEEIRIMKKGETIFLEKQRGGWKIRSPLHGGATRSFHEERIIHNLLSVFDYGIIDVIHENPKDLSEFGLDNPEFKLSIRVRGDSHLKTLLIGSDNPTRNSCYGKVEVFPTVLLLGILYKTDLDSIFDRLLVSAD